VADKEEKIEIEGDVIEAFVTEKVAVEVFS